MICLIIFAAFVGAMCFGTIVANKKGEVEKFMAPYDMNGNFCGVDGKKGYPILYVKEFDTSFTESFKKGVCVKSCPTSNKDKLECA